MSLEKIMYGGFKTKSEYQQKFFSSKDSAYATGRTLKECAGNGLIGLINADIEGAKAANPKDARLDDKLSQSGEVKNPDALNNSPTISANPLIDSINSVESPPVA